VNLTSANTRFERLRASDITKSFEANITSVSTTVALWTPATDKRFVLKGWRVVALTTGDVATASPFVLHFEDGTSDICPIFGFEQAPPNGVVLQDRDEIPCGWVSAAINQVLNLTTTTALTNGTLFVTGILWGEER
jgi:hypothetical protein